jgi:ABC-type sugar transport system ATPase subunit
MTVTGTGATRIASADAAESPILAVRGMRKAFGGVQALKDVSFEVLPGEIHALMGENGAGKSTLVKILSGAYKPDAGEIELSGQRVASISPGAARALGLSVIYQEFNLVPWMSVLDNVFLGRELHNRVGVLDRQAMRTQTVTLFEQLGVRIDPDARVAGLSVAQQQIVEIAKALATSAKVIIMDEPSAVLAGTELERLFDVVRALRDQGVAVIYISHRLVEVFALASRVTVLKDGRVVGTRAVTEITTGDLVRMMVGRDLQQPAGSPGFVTDEPLLAVRDVQVRPGGPLINFEVHAGEIVGIAGLVGSGRTSLARALAGVDPPAGGRMHRRGQAIHLRRPQDAMRHGIVLVPEDRKEQGVLLPLSLERNVSLPSLGRLNRAGFIRAQQERALGQAAIKDLDIRPAQPNVAVESLSGGNQQKVVLAKWLLTQPEVIVLDEPTRGIDVGAKFEIYRIMSELARRGAGILMISSELPEIIAMSDRILVMKDGAIVGSLSQREASEEAIMRLAVGHDGANVTRTPQKRCTSPRQA